MRQGRTKKHGAGGKFTWGTFNSDDLIPPEDPADPNYNSEEDKLENGHSPTTKTSQSLQHKHAVSVVQPGCDEVHAHPSADIHIPALQIALLIAEYYDSGDMDEAAEALQVSVSAVDLALVVSCLSISLIALHHFKARSSIFQKQPMQAAFMLEGSMQRAL